MELPLQYAKNHGKWFATSVLRALTRYRMISPGELVGVALSGGKDSSALLVILDYLRRHSHIKFQLLGIHVRMGTYDTTPLQELCRILDTPYRETQLKLPGQLPSKGLCSLCARLKRGAMARVLVREGIRKLALAHHAEDMAQTLLMNLARGATLRVFAPSVCLPGEPLELIRPLIYVNEDTLARIHKKSRIPLVGEDCPLGQDTFRKKAKQALEGLKLSMGDKLPLRMVIAAEKAGLWSHSNPIPPPQAAG
jgi:tRNA 2-thiocytidine biosynthesis protein TtcA